MAYEPSDLRPWAKSIMWVIGGLAVVVYIAAKIHWLMYWRPGHSGEYVEAHWPFWAAMLGLAALGWIVALVGRKPGG